MILLLFPQHPLPEALQLLPSAYPSDLLIRILSPLLFHQSLFSFPAVLPHTSLQVQRHDPWNRNGRHYQKVFGIDIPVENLAKRLWGNVWFNYQTRRFEGKTADTRSPRSFVQFCLEPM